MKKRIYIRKNIFFNIYRNLFYFLWRKKQMVNKDKITQSLCTSVLNTTHSGHYIPSGQIFLLTCILSFSEEIWKKGSFFLKLCILRSLHEKNINQSLTFCFRVSAPSLLLLYIWCGALFSPWLNCRKHLTF